MRRILFRHNAVRREQKRLMKDAREAIIKGMHLLAHAPTGLGKTDAALSAALTAAEENGCDVVFITPKNSQHEIAHRVVSDIVAKHKISINSVDLVGKRHLCNLKLLGEMPQEDFYHACKNMMKNGQCMYYENAKRKNGIAVPKHFNLSHGMVKSAGMRRGVCSYELAVNAAAKSKLIIADYAHVLIPSIADALLKRAGKKLGNSIVIVDEAHNLATRLRDQLSAVLSERLIARAEKECEYFDEGSLSFISGQFAEWARFKLAGAGEKIVEMDLLKALVERELDAEELVEVLKSVGNRWIEECGKSSACIRVANFLEFWNSNIEEEKFVRIIRKGRYGFAVEKRCLCPDVITERLNDAASAILMSGTLVPLQMYRDIVGLDTARTVMKEYESPFPKERKLVVADTSCTTKYSKRGIEEYKKIGARVSKYCAAAPGNTAVFFPSYAVLRGVLPHIDPCNKEIIVQKEGMSTHDVKRIKNRLMAEDRYVLAGVQGGVLSEGVDYEENSLKCIIVVGVPLEEITLETRARIDYYEKKFGKGWEYGYAGPALVKSMQAAGRGIRSEKDVGVVVFMDERFGWNAYKTCVQNTGGIKDVERFWNYWGEEMRVQSSSAVA